MQRWIPLTLMLALLGCEHNEKDSHTEVFKTPQEVVAERRSRQLQAHKELAISVLRFARPDLQAKGADGTSISVQADGVVQAIDLAPIEEQMVRHTSDERAILRRYLEEQLKPFDVERLKSVGFNAARKQAGFEWVNARDLSERQKAAGTSPLRAVPVVSGVYRLTVMRQSEAATAVPVTTALIDAWRVKADDVDAAATQNLREALASMGDNLIESFTFGPDGRSGNLKQGVDPAVIFLPEFLSAVQKNWKTRDNLVIFLPAPGGIVLVEQHNQKLLDILVPQWKKQLVATSNALCEQLLLREPEKIVLFAFSPTSQPVTAPTTKPKPYIVH